jgi:V-type H+-transporting ATPase 16kDa proteolipid subunit
MYNNTTSGYMGAASCMILSSWGSAWGTWRAGLGVCHMGIDHPAGIIKNIVPVVMAGVLGIYGLIVAVILAQAIVPPDASGSGGHGQNATVYSSFNGYTHVRAVGVKWNGLME